MAEPFNWGPSETSSKANQYPLSKVYVHNNSSICFFYLSVPPAMYNLESEKKHQGSILFCGP